MGREMEGAISGLGAAIEDLRTTMTAGAHDASRAFGEGVDSLLAAMNATLEGIRRNTADGATALREAALEMRAAAEGIRSELETAARDAAVAAERQLQSSGAEVSDAIGGAGAAIFKTTEEAAERARRELLQPLDALAEHLDALVRTLAGGTEQLGRLAANVRNGADATAEASDSFRESGRTLVEATAPVRESVDKLHASTDLLARSTRHVAESTRANTDSARSVLEAANEALGGSQRTLSATLREFQRVIERMDKQGEWLVNVDAELRKAFDDYRAKVQDTVEDLFKHVGKMQGELAPALDTMREITEQQLEFRPAARRR